MIENFYKGNIKGIEISVLDLPDSKTAEHVFNELNDNQYGLEFLDILEDDLVIDVGANIGIFSLYVKKKFNCKIISFEPVRSIFNLFKLNLSINNIKDSEIDLHNTGISSIEGEIIKIGTPPGNSGGSSEFYQNQWDISECLCETLDRYLDKKCKYLKIDCEGKEYEIIPAILHKLKNVENIGIEYHKVKDFSPNELHKMLSESFKGNIYSNINWHT
jgi:FkbM family methyltransferase